MLKILHLLSNWKWTERAEPAADMVLGQIRQGADVTFVCGRCPFEATDAVEHRVRGKGIEPVPMELGKHFNPFSALFTVPRLARFMREKKFDIVHAHMTNAHLLGGVAARRALPDARFVATFYEPDGPRDTLRNRLLLKRYTDGAVVITERARKALAQRFALPEDRTAVVEPGLDTARFAESVDRAAARASFGLAPGDRVVGMVTRIRAERRLDVALEAVAKLAPRHPTLKLMVVGRGGEGAVESVLEEPARALGIRDRLVLAGYCRDRRLVEAYKAMDVLAYPLHGTDPSCRTVREALAAGLPVAAGRVGYAADLVRDGVTGLLSELAPEPFAAALETLLADEAKRAAMGAGAAEEAAARFSSTTQAARCLAFYDKLERRR